MTRNHASKTVAVKTAADPDHPKRPYIGVFLQAATKISLPVPVRIDLGQTPWKFLKNSDPAGAETAAFDDSGWTDVGVPHTWNDSDTFINQQSGGGDGSMVGGNNWYRKHFTLDARYADRKVLVEFEGAHLGAQVYINGTFLPGNFSPRPILPFWCADAAGCCCSLTPEGSAS